MGARDVTLSFCSLLQAEQCEARNAAALLQRVPACVLPPPHGLLSPWAPGQLRHGVPVRLRGLLLRPASLHPGASCTQPCAMHYILLSTRKHVLCSSSVQLQAALDILQQASPAAALSASCLQTRRHAWTIGICRHLRRSECQVQEEALPRGENCNAKHARCVYHRND